MTEQVKKLIDSITVFTQHDVSCSGGLTEWVSKSDFDRVVEELYSFVGKSLDPHRCPVCNGNGLVPNGFYMQTSGNWSTSGIAPETCRSCGGTGVVWG